MTTDPILDDLFHACAWEAFIAEASAVQGWPDPEMTRQLAYRIYEEALAAERTYRVCVDDPTSTPRNDD